MTFTVNIQPSGYSFIVAPGQTVLAAALAHGYIFPHNCRQAVCGTCKGRLVAGLVDYADTDVQALTDEEREAGYALFCSARPLSDLIIFMPGVIGPEQIPVQKYLCAVQSCSLIAKDIFQVLLQPQNHAQVPFRAGQYLEVLQRDASPKFFSIANAPRADGLIELHVRFAQKNLMMQQLLDELQKNKKIVISAPHGTCIYQAKPDWPIIFIAGGVGFAPIKAIIEQAFLAKLDKPMYLYWGVRTRADFYLWDMVQSWCKQYPFFHFIPVLSEPHTESESFASGLVHEVVARDHPDLSQFQIYANGPVEMVYAALRKFLSMGLNRAYMHSDAFESLPAQEI